MASSLARNRTGAHYVAVPEGLDKAEMTNVSKALTSTLTKLNHYKDFHTWSSHFLSVQSIVSPNSVNIAEGRLTLTYKLKDDGSGETEEVVDDSGDGGGDGSAFAKHVKEYDFHNSVFYTIVYSYLGSKLQRSLGSAVSRGDGYALWEMLKKRANAQGELNHARKKTAFYSATQGGHQSIVDWTDQLNFLRDDLERQYGDEISDTEMCRRFLSGISKQYRSARTLGALAMEEVSDLSWDALADKIINHCSMMDYDQKLDTEKFAAERASAVTATEELTRQQLMDRIAMLERRVARIGGGGGGGGGGGDDGRGRLREQDVDCHNCGKRGHFSRNCPGGSSNPCMYCGTTTPHNGPGHCTQHPDPEGQRRLRERIDARNAKRGNAATLISDNEEYSFYCAN